MFCDLLTFLCLVCIAKGCGFCLYNFVCTLLLTYLIVKFWLVLLELRLCLRLLSFGFYV